MPITFQGYVTRRTMSEKFHNDENIDKAIAALAYRDKHPDIAQANALISIAKSLYMISSNYESSAPWA